jgi:hypothetical protein
VARLILIIFSVSYFIGTLWYIFCRLSSKEGDQSGSFFVYYQFDEWQVAGNNVDS